MVYLATPNNRILLPWWNAVHCLFGISGLFALISVY